MAIEYTRQLKWIVAKFTCFRKVDEGSNDGRAVMEIELSIGRNKTNEDGSIALNELGEEIWLERWTKAFPVWRYDLVAYLMALADPATDAKYRFTLPSQLTSAYDADALMSAPIYAMAQWLLDTGRWDL